MDEADKLPNLKPPTTVQQQIEILKSRNLVVDDEQFASTVLHHINYYRLSGYMLSLKKDDVFKPGTTFEIIYRLYEFDRRLRNLLSGLLELIEISARACTAYHLAIKHGSLCYENENIFQDKNRHAPFVSALNKSIEDARKGHELFVEHHDTKYAGKLPIWSVTELMSFGTLSIFYANLQPEDRKQIAENYYGVKAFYLRSWLRSLSFVRNVCAHHARIYNKPITITPELYPDDKERLNNARIFTLIFVAGILCPDSTDWSSFETSLEALIDEYADVLELDRIGFPPDWRSVLRDTVTTRRFSAETYRLRSKK